MTYEFETFCSDCGNAYDEKTGEADLEIIRQNLERLIIDNPDFVEVTLHSYRHRHRNAPGDPNLESVEIELSRGPAIEVPTIVLRGGDSGFGRPSSSIEIDRNHFTNLIGSHVVEGGGHDLPVQKPDIVYASIQKLVINHN